MKTWNFDSPGPETTKAFAVELGRSIADVGLAIGLIGPLGAGKTVFVKGLAQGLGVEPSQVSSPTFVIAQQYPLPPEPSPRPHVLHHVDLYRLELEAELDAIGFADLFEAGSVIATEWADRFPGVLGPERLEVELEGPSLGEASRRGRQVQVRAYGEVAEATLEDWVDRVERMTRLSAPAGGEGVGSSPQRRAEWMLVMALLIWGGSHFETPIAVSPCRNPDATSADLLGTVRVVCRDSSEGIRAPEGVGGLLFGNPLVLESVTASQLEALPGIGPRRAAAILATRARSGFRSLSDLERVSGIGPKLRERLSRWLRVESGRPISASDSMRPLPSRTDPVGRAKHG